MLFDFKIRQVTGNKKSLDDVMRFLYKEYYQKKKRGFTEEELRAAFENIAGTSLAGEFDYITTTKELEYPKYFSYAGLTIDTSTQVLPNPYVGFTVSEREGSVVVSNVDYESPAWNAGIRRGQTVLEIDWQKATLKLCNSILSNMEIDKMIKLKIISQGTATEYKNIIPGKKKEKIFPIAIMGDPDPSQKQILESWLKG